MALSAVLFDFDGTLVDTTELIYQSMHHATSTVLGREYPRETLLNGVGRPLSEQMKIFDAGHADELLDVYRRHNEAHHDEFIREFPGIEEALSRLREAGLELAVVTSKSRISVEQTLARFPGLGEVVDHFVAMEDTTKHKPNPEPLLKGAEALGVLPRETAYVGDSPYDIAAAKAAGITSVGVSWGAFPPESLREAEPGYLFPEMDGAVELLLGMAGTT